MSEVSNQSLDAESNDVSARFANKTLQDYEVLSVIGSGSFGTCFKVRDKATGELFAWKGIDYDELSEKKRESLVSEIKVLRQLRHPNIVQYYHHLVNHEAKSIFIVMECCEGGDLSQLITRARAERKRFEEHYIWRVLLQVCRALQVCHNQIKRGTILHRDIKPANIFLDAQGNAKLGDFGLARMLRRNESFAESFVGTPYYMSPELVKGSKYDRKSDVWAVGCLIYEMCALRPPFKGRQFEQLSANISHGKFSSIPEAFSDDLQDIITFMLEVENEQRPSVEVVTRHPLLMRNIKNVRNEFPQLVACELLTESTITDEQLPPIDYHLWTDLSSTAFTEHNSFREEYGQRRLSFSGVFTPDLRTELFYSAQRRIFPRAHALQLSDPELYESIRREDYAVNEPLRPEATNVRDEPNSPAVVTQLIFDQVLQERLHAIRAQESLLQQRELNLNMREQSLNEREKRLQLLEHSLQQKLESIDARLQQSLQSEPKQLNAARAGTLDRNRMPLPTEALPLLTPPPIPPRRPVAHDETYCTIEPNDTLLQPTVAKLNMATLPAVKAFPTLRKVVTFQSPQKFIKYDIENLVQTGKVVAPAANAARLPPSSVTSGSGGSSAQLQASVSSKGSDDSSDSTTHRRKSILSLFGLTRSNKESKTSVAATVAPAAPVGTTNQMATIAAQFRKERPPLAPKSDAVLVSKRETAELTNIWTKEHKRAAFDMLAAMNAAERDGERQLSQNQRNRLRQSVRDRNTLQRNRLRRSLMAVPQPPSIAIATERIIV